MSTSNTGRGFGWKHVVIGVFSGLAAILVTAIEWLWISGWSNKLAMYTPVAISFAASCALIGGLLVVRSKPWHSLWIGTISSVCVVVGTLSFLVEIQPIAAGNNDSVEVFPFVFLPAIWIFGFAIIGCTKLRKLRLHEALPWQQ